MILSIDQITIAAMLLTLSGYFSLKGLGKLFKID